jgi:hypothetical protein
LSDVAASFTGFYTDRYKIPAEEVRQPVGMPSPARACNTKRANADLLGLALLLFWNSPHYTPRRYDRMRLNYNAHGI